MTTTELLMCARTPAALPAPRPILFGADFSPASDRAFRRAIETARREGAELLVVHVYSAPSLIGIDGAVSPFSFRDLEESLRKEARRQLDEIVQRARGAGISAEGVLLSGNATEELTGLARQRNASMLVVGTHGRTGLARLFAGSVASAVVATSPCPVLTVR